jgi:hypothetical protein
MLRHVPWVRIRWVGIILGVAAAMLFVWLLVALVDSVIIPYLHGIFAVERPGGVTSFSGRNAILYDILTLLALLSTFPLALFLGGLVVGGVVRSLPGLHGALSGAVVAAVGLAWSSANTLAILLDPVSDTPFDDAEKFLILTVGLCVLSPIAILAGFLGGRLGGRLRRSRATPRSAS